MALGAIVLNYNLISHLEETLIPQLFSRSQFSNQELVTYRHVHSGKGSKGRMLGRE